MPFHIEFGCGHGDLGRFDFLPRLTHFAFRFEHPRARGRNRGLHEVLHFLDTFIELIGATEGGFSRIFQRLLALFEEVQRSGAMKFGS